MNALSLSVSSPSRENGNLASQPSHGFHNERLFANRKGHALGPTRRNVGQHQCMHETALSPCPAMHHHVHFQVASSNLPPVRERANRNQLAYTAIAAKPLFLRPPDAFPAQPGAGDQSWLHSLQAIALTLSSNCRCPCRSMASPARQREPSTACRKSDPRLPTAQSEPPSPPLDICAALLAASHAFPCAANIADRVFAMIPSHLDELVQDQSLAISIRCLVAVAYRLCQLPTRSQLDSSPHLRHLPTWYYTSGSIFDEATTHCSVAKIVSQCDGKECLTSDTALFFALQHPRTLRIKNHSDGGRILGLLQLHRKLRHPHRQTDARATLHYQELSLTASAGMRRRQRRRRGQLAVFRARRNSVGTRTENRTSASELSATRLSVCLAARGYSGHPPL